MAKAPAFQWYPKDCDTDEHVKGMDDAEFGFYVRCLNHAWLNNGLPVEIAEFARVMGKTPKQFLKLWARVSRCFSENSEKRFINFRQEQQRSEQDNFKKKQVDAVNSRWANKSGIPPYESGITKPIPDAYSASASATTTAKQEDQNHLPPAVAVATVAAKKVRSINGTRLQADELPADWAKYAMEKFSWSREKTLDVFEGFHDFWKSKATEARKLDWFLTWKNWCKEDVRRQGRPPTLFPPQESHTERAIRIGHERIRETGRL